MRVMFIPSKENLNYNFLRDALVVMTVKPLAVIDKILVSENGVEEHVALSDIVG